MNKKMQNRLASALVIAIGAAVFTVSAPVLANERPPEVPPRQEAPDRDKRDCPDCRKDPHQKHHRHHQIDHEQASPPAEPRP